MGNENTRSYANKKLFGKSFRGMDLTHGDFRGATLYECDFSEADLSYANFETAQCYGANFHNAKIFRTSFKDAVLAKATMTPAQCFGMTITLNCDSVEGLKVGRQWFLSYLFMALMTEPVGEDLEKIKTAIINAMGEETYSALHKMFKQRQV